MALNYKHNFIHRFTIRCTVMLLITYQLLQIHCIASEFIRDLKMVDPEDPTITVIITSWVYIIQFDLISVAAGTETLWSVSQNQTHYQSIQ